VLAHMEIDHACSNSINFSNHVIARDERERRLAGIHPTAHENIRKRHADGKNLHANFSRTRVQQFVFDYLQNFWPALAGDDHARIFQHKETLSKPRSARIAFGCR
jgi:hypothetical protein